MYLAHEALFYPNERVMTTLMRISDLSISQALTLLFLSTMFVPMVGGQIVYDWQGSKEGWVPASEPNLGCNLVEQPEAMAMRAFNATPVMRSGTVSESLNIDASEYDRVQITLKNPTSSGNPNARLFAYPPESNSFMCHWNVAVDTAMTDFQTYTLDLTSPPNAGSGSFEGALGRFGWRGPWGVANGDTIYWKSMVVYNSEGCTNADACNYAPFAEVDNGMCVLVGDSCDDGNPETLNDVITGDCLCAGEVDLLEERVELKTLELAPNPASVYIQARSEGPLGVVRVLDVHGRVWMREETTEFTLLLDVNSLSPGTYFLETGAARGRTISRFVVHRP